MQRARSRLGVRKISIVLRRHELIIVTDDRTGVRGIGVEMVALGMLPQLDLSCCGSGWVRCCEEAISIGTGCGMEVMLTQ